MPGSKRYDVFISYRHRDKDTVHRIARRLADDAGLEPFVDAWNLVPGDRFTPALAQAVNESRSVAVFKGPDGMSEWVQEETELALTEHIRVIPVLLPGAAEELPAFLPIRTFVDFRGSIDDPEAFRQLVAGIRGEAPGRPPDLKDSRQYQSVTLSFFAKDDGYWGEVRGSHIRGHEAVQLQLDPAAIRHRFEQAMRPTHTVLRKGTTTKVPDASALTGVGTELYQLLIGSDLGDALEEGLRSVDRQRGLGVRLLVDTSKAPALARLPWEFLSQPESGLSLSSSPFTPVTRWFDLEGGLPSLLLTRPLRLLVISAAPRDRPPVSLLKELAQLKSQLSEVTLFETLDHATPEALKDALHRFRPSVLHFVGHGEVNDGRGAIVLEAEDGSSNPVTGRGLAVLLENDVPPLQLVFLNSCEGGAVASDDPFGGVAEALVRQHLPAVVAMQFPIPDDAAVALARGFYRDVMAGTPVDAALSSARGVLYADNARFEGFEWGTPALYVRLPRVALIGPPAVLRTVIPVAVAAAGTPSPSAPQAFEKPRDGLAIGTGFFADRWVAIGGIAAVTLCVLTAMFVYVPLTMRSIPDAQVAEGPRGSGVARGPAGTVAAAPSPAVPPAAALTDEPPLATGPTSSPSPPPPPPPAPPPPPPPPPLPSPLPSPTPLPTPLPSPSPQPQAPSTSVPPQLPCGPIMGLARSSSGEPVSGIRIVLRDARSNTAVATSVTTPDGYFRVGSAACGTYVVQCVADNGRVLGTSNVAASTVNITCVSDLASSALGGVAIDAMLGAERHDVSDASGSVAVGLLFGDEGLRPFARAGFGAAARDAENAWMFFDAGLDVRFGGNKGFVGAGAGVRTTFSDARGTVFVHGGVGSGKKVEWILEGRWIQSRDGASQSDYSVLTGVRIPLK